MSDPDPQPDPPYDDAAEGDIQTDDSSDIRQFRFRLGKNLTRRIDQYLVDRVRYLSRAGVQRLIGEGLVKVNGKSVKASYHPSWATRWRWSPPPEPVNELMPEPIPLDVLFEDEHLLALNKQADLMVHPARGKMDGDAGQRPGALRPEVEHDQRQLAAGDSPPPRPQYHRHHARRQKR